MSKAARIRHWVHGAYRFAKTTVIGGLVFVVPLFVLVWLGAKALKLLRRVAEPLAALLPLDRVIGVLAADALVVALLIIVCFIGGLLARVSSAYHFVKRAESGVLWRIPGYGFIRALTETLDKNTAASTMRPVLIHFDDAAQLAFEVDQLPDGRRVVYIPSSPDPRAGSVMVMDADRVEPLPLTFMAALRDLRALGRGLGADMRASAGLTKGETT
jgi:uncharacterized membrane protein